MGTVKTIRCHYCRKLLWSIRWPAAKRRAYREHEHSCEGKERAMLPCRLERALAAVEKAHSELTVARDVIVRLARPR